MLNFKQNFEVCVSKPWFLHALGRIALAHVKIWGPAPPNGWNVVSRKNPLGWFNTVPITFLLVDQSSPIFSSNKEWNIVDQALFRFSLCWSVRKILWSKLKVVKNRAKFWTFFALPNFVGATLPKLVSTLSPLPRATSLEKVCEVMPSTPKVIGTLMLMFEPNFECLPLKIFGGPLFPFGACAIQQGWRHEFHNGGYKIVNSPNSYKLGEVHDAYNAQLCCKS